MNISWVIAHLFHKSQFMPNFLPISIKGIKKMDDLGATSFFEILFLNCNFLVAYFLGPNIGIPLEIPFQINARWWKINL